MEYNRNRCKKCGKIKYPRGVTFIDPNPCTCGKTEREDTWIR